MSVARRTPSGIGIMTLRSMTAIDSSSFSVSMRRWRSAALSPPPCWARTMPNDPQTTASSAALKMWRFMAASYASPAVDEIAAQSPVGDHDVRFHGALVHQPGADGLPRGRQSERLARRERNGDRDVALGPRMLAVGARHRVPQRSVFRFRARPVLFHLVEQRFRLLTVAGRFRFQVLRLALEISDAGAVHGERLLQRESGSLVAHQLVRAFTQRLVREVLVPLDDRRLILEASRRRDERDLHVGPRCARLERRRGRRRLAAASALREQAGRERENTDRESCDALHVSTSFAAALKGRLTRGPEGPPYIVSPYIVALNAALAM